MAYQQTVAERVTQATFDYWPMLLDRWHLRKCGFTPDLLKFGRDGYLVLVKNGEPTPPGKIGVVRTDPRKRQGKYRKCDVAVLIGLKM